jgi:hypothetical protein
LVPVEPPTARTRKKYSAPGVSPPGVSRMDDPEVLQLVGAPASVGLSS